MDSFDLKSPVKRATKVYGKRSLLSSSLPRPSISSSVLSNSESSSSSSSSDEDDFVIGVLRGGIKGKEKERITKNSRTQSTPSKLPSNLNSTANSSTLGSTVASLLSIKAEHPSTLIVSGETGIKNGNGNNVEGSNEVEWDELADRATKVVPAVKVSASKLPTVKPNPTKTSTSTPSISSVKRNRIVETSITISSSPVLLDQSPKPKKRLKGDIPAIVKNLPSSVSSSPVIRRSTSQTQIRPISPTLSPARSPSRGVISTPPRSPVQRSVTPPSGRSPSTSRVIPVMLSPAKDVSSLFQQFTNLSPSTTSKDSTSTGGNVVSKPSSLISGLGARSPSKITSNLKSSLPPSPSHSSSLNQKSNSYPLLSISPSPPRSSNSYPHSLLPPSSNHQPEASTSTLPSKITTFIKPLIQANTSLGIPSTSSATLSTQSNIALAGSSSFTSRVLRGNSKRTYGAGGGGGRSFKRDEEEERLFGFDASLASTGGTTSPARSLGGKVKGSSGLPYKEKESYATLRSKWGVDYEEDLDDFNNNIGNNFGNGTGNNYLNGEGGIPNDLKSVSHLREKGETTRFGDEFNYLVEGLESTMSLGVRRASAIEVLRKMLEVDFVRRLMASDFVERLFINFRKAEAGDGTDRVLDSALTFLVILLIKDGKMAEPLLRVPISKSGTSSYYRSRGVGGSDVLDILNRNLNQKWAGDEIVGTGAPSLKGVSKSDLRSLASLRDIIDKSAFGKNESFPINLRSLSLVSLSIFASFTTRSSIKPQDLICSSGALDSVITTFLQETKGIDSRISKYENGLDLLPSDGTINLTLIATSLQIIESCSQSNTMTYNLLTQHLPSLTSSLINLILASHILTSDSNLSSKINSKAMKVLLSSLRMLIDLTTNQGEAWSQELIKGDGEKNNEEIVGTLVKIIVGARQQNISTDRAQSSKEAGEERELEGSGEEKESSITLRYDLLCLALGVLTNLVETVSSTKDILRDTLIDSECQESRKCARKCQCLNRKTSIYRLTDLYLDPLTDSLNELNTSFINGYSGILLGLIMLDLPSNQTIILEALVDHPRELRNLIGAMEEFANLHEQALEKRGGEEGAELIKEEEESTQVIEEMDVEVEVIVEEKVENVASRIRDMLKSLK